MKRGGVDFWTHISFWGYIFGTFIEVALWFEPFFDQSNKGVVAQVQEENRANAYKAPSMELDDLHMEQENEIEKRITHMKKSKTAIMNENAEISKSNANANSKAY